MDGRETEKNHGGFARRNMLLFRGKWSTIDSITQNEESKIAYEYVVILRNNKFEHKDVYYFKEIDYLKHTARGKIWKQQQTEKKLW